MWAGTPEDDREARSRGNLVPLRHSLILLRGVLCGTRDTHLPPDMRLTLTSIVPTVHLWPDKGYHALFATKIRCVSGLGLAAGEKKRSTWTNMLGPMSRPTRGDR